MDRSGGMQIVEINNYLILCTPRNDEECGKVGRGSVKIKDEE